MEPDFSKIFHPHWQFTGNNKLYSTLEIGQRRSLALEYQISQIDFPFVLLGYMSSKEVRTGLHRNHGLETQRLGAWLSTRLAASGSGGVTLLLPYSLQAMWLVNSA